MRMARPPPGAGPRGRARRPGAELRSAWLLSRVTGTSAWRRPRPGGGHLGEPPDDVEADGLWAAPPGGDDVRGDLLVAGQPTPEDGRQLRVPQQRAAPVAAGAQHRLLVADLKVDDLAAPQRPPGRRVLHRPAAEREHRVRAAQELRRDLVLERAE